MDNKKYWMLLPPFILIFIFFVIYLPLGIKQYSMLVPIVFWTVYYIWVYVDKNNKKDKSRSEGVDK